MNPRSLNEQDPLPALGPRIPKEVSPPTSTPADRQVAPGVREGLNGKLYTEIPENERAGMQPTDWIAAEKSRRWYFFDDLQEDTREHDNGLGQWLSEHQVRQGLRAAGIDPDWTDAKQEALVQSLGAHHLKIWESCDKTEVEDGYVVLWAEHAYHKDPVTRRITRVA